MTCYWNIRAMALGAIWNFIWLLYWKMVMFNYVLISELIFQVLFYVKSFVCGLCTTPCLCLDSAHCNAKFYAKERPAMWKEYIVSLFTYIREHLILCHRSTLANPELRFYILQNPWCHSKVAMPCFWVSIYSISLLLISSLCNLAFYAAGCHLLSSHTRLRLESHIRRCVCQE